MVQRTIRKAALVRTKGRGGEQKKVRGRRKVPGDNRYGKTMQIKPEILKVENFLRTRRLGAPSKVPEIGLVESRSTKKKKMSSGAFWVVV